MNVPVCLRFATPVLLLLACAAASPKPSHAQGVKPWVEAAPPSSPGSRNDLDRRAAAVTSALASDSLGRTWSQWINSHRDECEAFRGSSYSIDAKEYWVYRCSSELGGGRLSADFYLLAQEAEPTLERIEWTIGRAAGFSPENVDRLANRVVEVLRAAWGRPDRPPPDSLSEPGSGFWADVARFRSPTARLLLYRTASLGTDLDSLTLELSSARLLAHLGDQESWDTFGQWPESRSWDESRQEVSRALPSRWSRLAAALRHSSPRNEDLPVVREALAWATSHHDPSEESDLLRYAAHLWLRGFRQAPGWDRGDSATVRPFRDALSPLGIAIVQTHGGSWCYDEALADTLAAKAGQHRWADLAFLELLDRGWESPCGLCGWGKPFGPDRFRPVIQHGNAYLRAHPDTDLAPIVRLRVAEAHETAWSLSKAAPGDEYIDWRRYALGAAEHRAKAIELYDEAFRRRPDLVDASVLDRLRRLHLDVDTSFHKYWCLWD